MDDEIDLSNAELFATDSRGVYIPQYFAETVLRQYVTNVTDWQWLQLEAGPHSEHYWDAWTSVLDNARLTTPQGVEHYLYQDGDLWVIPKLSL